MPGWTVDRFEADDAIPGVVGYAVRWRRGDGSCVEVFGSNDGLGGPEYPIVSAEVTLAELPGAPRYRVYKAADDPASASAENWGPGGVISDFVEVGDEGSFMAVWLSSAGDDGCRPVSLQDGAAILASLRPLDPAHLGESESTFGDEVDMGAFGRFGLADDVFESFITDVPTTSAPEAAVRDWVEDLEAEEILVETAGEAEDRTFVLALLDGLYDDSIRGERLLFVFSREGGGWGLTWAGRQVRCHTGRGHQDWTPEPCL